MLEQTTTQKFHDAIIKDDLQRQNNFNEPLYFSTNFTNFTASIKSMKQALPRLDGWERKKLVEQLRDVINGCAV